MTKFKNLASVFIIGFLLSTLLLVPSFADYFTQSKWFGFYLFSALAAIYLVFQAQLQTLPHAATKIFIGIGFLWLLSLIKNFSSVNTLLILRITASFFVILFYREFFKLKNWFGTFLFSAGLAGGLHLIFQDWFFLQHQNVDYFFGHENMSAELNGFFILICVFCFLRTIKTWHKWILLLLAFNSFACIVRQNTRSVYLALILAVGYLFIFNLSDRMRRKIKWPFMALGLIAFLVIILPNLNVNSSSAFSHLKFFTNEGKAQSAQNRLARWLNTLVLIKENPLGTGFQSYEFSYLPYRNAVKNEIEVREIFLSLSPHNSFLDAAAEHGILLAFSLFALFGWLIIQTSRSSNQTAESRALTSTWIYLLGLGLTAFPFELAWSYNLSLLCLTYFFVTLFGSRNFLVTRFYRVVIIFGTGVLIFLIAGFSFSLYAEKNFVDEIEFNNLSCQLFPSQWRVCLNEVKIALEKKQDHLADLKAQAVLQRQPLNYIALGLRAQALDRLGHKDEACAVMHSYTGIWGENHSLRNFQAEVCRP